MVGALVFPDVILGIIDASITLKLSIPLTFRSSETTASSSLPILQVPTGGFNLTWFAILVAVNLQTAWLSPPVALSAYFLKGVVPEWDLKDIYIGMMQFMALQVFGLILIIIFPKIALWLPTLLYGQ